MPESLLAEALSAAEPSDIKDPATYNFAKWYQVSADRPALVLITTEVEATGGNEAKVAIDLDKTGDSTVDVMAGTNATNATGLTTNPNVISESTTTVYVPPGGQVQVTNTFDPNGTNSIIQNVEIIL